MKTLNTNAFVEAYKAPLILVAAIVGLMSLAACSSNKSPSLDNRFSRCNVGSNCTAFNGSGNLSTSGVHWGFFYAGAGYYPQTPGYYPQTLLEGPDGFLPDVSDLGAVSDAESTSSAGIFFGGSISISSQSGELQLIINDTTCISTGNCYAPEFSVSPTNSVDVNGTMVQTSIQNQSNIIIVGEDSEGAIILEGGISGSYFEGSTVGFVNNASYGGALPASGSFGSFVIPEQYLFTN